jgi:amino acid transporter
MNQQSEKSLQKLAEKLGTSAEYLWEVLVNQAPIQGFLILLQIILILLSVFLLYKLHRYFLKNDVYDEYEEGAAIFMILAAMIVATFIIFGFIHIPEMIYAFLNPEYWALRQILEKV